MHRLDFATEKMLNLGTHNDSVSTMTYARNSSWLFLRDMIVIANDTVQ